MAGMSLVELLVAVALGLLILAALTTVFVNSSTARREIDLTSQQIENGRYAIEILTDDLRLAGYFGELDPVPANAAANVAADASWVPAVVPPVALPDPCTIPADLKDWRPALYLPLQGYLNGIGVPAACSDAPTKATNIKTNADATTNPDIVVVRRARACAVGEAGCEALDDNKPYLQVSLCATEAPTTPYLLALGSDSNPPTLRLKGAAPGICGATVAPRQYMTHVYFISKDNGSVSPAPTCPNSDPKIDREVCVPTLKRLELTTNPITGVLEIRGVSLVEGIEQFNVEYGIDYMDSAGLPSVDGIPDAYTSDPANFADATGCPACLFNAVDNWRNVLTARFYVLARNINTSSGLSDDAKAKTYTLGSKPDGTPLTVGPFNDNYRRHMYSSLVRVANPAGRRDRP
jgi:type IV pilus assembly protein PilW